MNYRWNYPIYKWVQYGYIIYTCIFSSEMDIKWSGTVDPSETHYFEGPFDEDP